MERRNIKIGEALSGQNSNFYKHGGAGTRLYGIWKGMRKRCYNTRCGIYRWYGNKGINVCPEWDDYAVFKEWAVTNGYADSLVIHRKNSKLNYTPDNCEFITRSENARERNKKSWEENYEGTKV